MLECRVSEGSIGKVYAIIEDGMIVDTYAAGWDQFPPWPTAWLDALEATKRDQDAD